MSREKPEHFGEGAEPRTDSDKPATNPGEDLSAYVVENEAESDEENQANIHFF